MSELHLHQTFLVIGAGGLLGSRLVQYLLGQSANIIAADIDTTSSQSRLLELGVDVNSDKIKFLQVDISDGQSVKDLFNDLGEIDGAVNAAYPRGENYGAHFFDVSLDEFNKNVSLNLGGSFVFMQQCAAYFRDNKKPFSLVNISSVYGTVVPDFKIYNNTLMTMPVEYAAIKSALLHLSRYVAAYVNDSNFRINSVSPGGLLDQQPEPFLNAYKEKTHGTGMLGAEDITGAVSFLLSDLSRYIVGQNIIVDDGFGL